MPSELRRVMKITDHVVFAVAGPAGGIHFWFKQSAPDSCGVETHRPAESGDKCWLIGQPCEHDGSTLYAREKYLPLFDDCNHTGNFEPLWLKLATEYRQRLESDHAK